MNGYITDIAITNNVITDSLTTRHVTVTLDVNQFVKKEVNEIIVGSGFVGNIFHKIITVTSHFVPLYGIIMPSSNTSTTLTRIANDMTLHATLPVHEAMLPCDINPSTGSITYLNKNDLTKDINGNTVTIPSTSNNLNRMIELPECWLYYAQSVGGWYCYLVSLEEFTTEDANDIEDISIYTYYRRVIHFPKRYISMYEGYNYSNKIRSIPGQTPTTSTAGSSFHSYCRANNSSNYNWNMLTSDVWNFVNLMFHIEYATKNSQLSFNSSLTSEGYHQGGLGAGITSSSLTANPTLTNCDSYGADGGSTYCCYRGIVNPFGNCRKELVDVYIVGDGADSILYKSHNKSKYSRSNPSYGRVGLMYSYFSDSSGWILDVKIYPHDNGRLTSVISGTYSSEDSFKDYYYYGGSGTYGWFTGGAYGYGSNASLQYSNCNNSVGNSNSNIE